jgi:organic hydroperoxide reductase OsmC/OhrA
MHQRRIRTRLPAEEAADFVNPEEAFVASLSSCHMLTFLAIACKQKFVLDSYEDEAVGHLEKNADGKLAITRVELRPRITWGDDRKPSAEELDKMPSRRP